MRASQQIQGSVKNVTLSRQGQDWFFLIQTEQEIETPMHPATTMLGTDLRFKRFATFSDGLSTMELVNRLKQALRLELLSVLCHVNESSLSIGKPKSLSYRPSTGALKTYVLIFCIKHPSNAAKTTR